MAVYTTIDDPSAFFQIKLWTGTDNSSQAFTLDGNSDLQPDWVWIKNRGYANKHVLFDSVRGVNKSLTSNSTDAEVDQNSDGGYLSAFNSDGFTLTEGSGSDNDTNDDRYTYVSWNWKAGGSASNNTSGQLTSSVSVNQDAGFSVLTYTGVGDGSSGTARTVGHGLGVTPAVLIIKNRADSTQWNVYHHKNTSAPETDIIYLNLTNATSDDNGFWNDTAPTSSLFTVGGDNGVNGNNDSMVCYAFAEKQGYSKFGSYTGNGNSANGTFVYTGFKPAWVIVKRSSGTDNWMITDTKRSTSNGNNVINRRILPNLSNAEYTNTSPMDILSNGFKHRDNDDINNANGSTYIYMAFAEQPFVTSTGIPATAR